MSEQEAPTKGRACIYVTDDLIRLAEVKIEKPKAGEIHWGGMEVAGMLDTWQAFLLLPEGYTIVGSFFDVYRYLWVVIVESDALPLLKEGEVLPLLMPKYQVNYAEDGTQTVSIIDMQVVK